ncbi:hypothetical protein ABW19_dt0203958 [Dactylella cylindrospora]|nr:hypothetical protein ABW19_dt0203958 [Dactylella cylindrospora]
MESWRLEVRHQDCSSWASNTTLYNTPPLYRGNSTESPLRLYHPDPQNLVMNISKGYPSNASFPGANLTQIQKTGYRIRYGLIEQFDNTFPNSYSDAGCIKFWCDTNTSVIVGVCGSTGVYGLEKLGPVYVSNALGNMFESLITQEPGKSNVTKIWETEAPEPGEEQEEELLYHANIHEVVDIVKTERLGPEVRVQGLENGQTCNTFIANLKDEPKSDASRALPPPSGTMEDPEFQVEVLRTFHPGVCESVHGIGSGRCYSRASTAWTYDQFKLLFSEINGPQNPEGKYHDYGCIFSPPDPSDSLYDPNMICGKYDCDDYSGMLFVYCGSGEAGLNSPADTLYNRFKALECCIEGKIGDAASWPAGCPKVSCLHEVERQPNVTSDRYHGIVRTYVDGKVTEPGHLFVETTEGVDCCKIFTNSDDQNCKAQDRYRWGTHYNCWV